MSYRLHPLYARAREVSRQPIAWDNPDLVRLQSETRLDLMEHTPTFDLIAAIAGPDDAVDWMETLTDIKAQPERASTYDVALGEGRN